MSVNTGIPPDRQSAPLKRLLNKGYKLTNVVKDGRGKSFVLIKGEFVIGSNCDVVRFLSCRGWKRAAPVIKKKPADAAKPKGT